MGGQLNKSVRVETVRCTGSGCRGISRSRGVSWSVVHAGDDDWVNIGQVQIVVRVTRAMRQPHLLEGKERRQDNEANASGLEVLSDDAGVFIRTVRSHRPWAENHSGERAHMANTTANAQANCDATMIEAHHFLRGFQEASVQQRRGEECP